MSDESAVIYEKIIFENMEKGFQLRLVVNLFREVEYLHIRKYFLDFEGEFVPSKEGISMPMSVSNTYSLLDGLIDICAQRESVDSVSQHFLEILTKIKENDDK